MTTKSIDWDNQKDLYYENDRHWIAVPVVSHTEKQIKVEMPNGRILTIRKAEFLKETKGWGSELEGFGSVGRPNYSDSSMLMRGIKLSVYPPSAESYPSGPKIIYQAKR